jgi:MFS family permease
MIGAQPTPLLTRHFVLVCGITFLTFLAAFQLFPTVPLQLRGMGASLAESGRFMTAFTAGSAGGALFTGPLGDRLGQRRMMVVCAFLFALLVGAYGWLGSRAWFYVLAVPHGIVWSGLLTATLSTLGGILPPDRRADGMSLYGLASPGGAMLGPVLGVAVYGRFGFRAMGAVLSLLFLLLTALALSLPKDRPHAHGTPTLRLPDPILLAPCLVLFVSALGYGVLGSYTVQEALALGFPRLGPLSLASTFLSLMALGMVLMRIVMGHLGFGARPVALLPRMMGAATLGLGLLAFAPGGLARHAVSALLYGAGYSMMHTLVSTYVLNVVHAERRGTAFGATLFSFDAGIGLGNLGLGFVIGAFGFRTGWACAALLTGLALPLSIHLSRHDARREREPSGPTS